MLKFSFPYKSVIQRHKSKTVFFEFNINKAFHKPIILILFFNLQPGGLIWIHT